MVYAFDLEVSLKNRFLQTIHNMLSMNDLSKEEKSERIKKILEDVNFLEDNKKSYIFEKPPSYISDEERFFDLEETADIVFGKDFNGFGLTEEEESPYLDWERIRRKQKELGIKVKKNKIELDRNVITRYGRCPLHEAVAMKDVKLIRKYAKKIEYLRAKDNSGNIPYQMALSMGYEEAIKILKFRSRKFI